MTPKNRLKTQKKRLVPHEKFFQEKTIFRQVDCIQVKIMEHQNEELITTEKLWLLFYNSYNFI
jgi:hypothetical protein